MRFTCMMVSRMLPDGRGDMGLVPCTFFVARAQASIHAGEEDAARDALEALNVVAAKQPELLVDGQGLEVVAKAMLALASSPALEVRFDKAVAVQICSWSVCVFLIVKFCVVSCSCWCRFSVVSVPLLLLCRMRAVLIFCWFGNLSGVSTVYRDAVSTAVSVFAPMAVS